MFNSLAIRYTGNAHKLRLLKKFLAENTKIRSLKTMQGATCTCDTTYLRYILPASLKSLPEKV